MDVAPNWNTPLYAGLLGLLLLILSGNLTRRRILPQVPAGDCRRPAIERAIRTRGTSTMTFLASDIAICGAALPGRF